MLKLKMDCPLEVPKVDSSFHLIPPLLELLIAPPVPPA
jgi:hypothetical protein